MAEEANLPEEIIVYIISRLPVKILMQFTSVCKRWRSIISFDLEFSIKLRRNKILNRRLLACTRPSIYPADTPPKLESLDLELDLEPLSSKGKKLHRKLNLPFQPTGGTYFDLGHVSLVGSCNGLVSLAQNNVFSVFNPLTRFVKELPRRGYPPKHVKLTAYGFGYLSATDEYKVFVSYYNKFEEVKQKIKKEIEKKFLGIDEVVEEENLPVCQVISLRDQIWRRIEGIIDYMSTLSVCIDLLMQSLVGRENYCPTEVKWNM